MSEKTIEKFADYLVWNDLIMYKVTSIASNNKQISSLIKYDIIKNIDNFYKSILF